MKKGIAGFALSAVLVLVAAMPVQAGDKNGCSIAGTWMGFTGPNSGWVATNDGKTINAGSVTLEVTGFDATLNGWFANAQKGAVIVRGNWKRVGTNVSYIDGVSLAVDTDGNTLYVARLYGFRTIMDDCNTVLIGPLTLALYAPAQNPYAPDAEPFYQMSMPDHFGFRLPAEAPAE